MWQAQIGRNIALPDGGGLASPEQILNTFTPQYTPRTEGPKSITVECDFAGRPLLGQLDQAIVIKRFEGLDDVSMAATWSLDSTGSIATISSGLIRIAACQTGGKLVATSQYNGFTIVHEIEVRKNNAAPPVLGQSGAAFAVDTTIETISSSVLQSGAGPLIVAAGAAGGIDLSGYLSFTTSGTNIARANGQIRYRQVGSTPWLWASAEVTSIFSARPSPEIEQGEIDTSTLLLGLTVGVSYEIELMLRCSSGNGSLFFVGSFAAKGI
jgi:hypothetical protein